MKKTIAFTLAEVLVTLGIIGVVAALTLPTVIKKYQKYVIANQLKTTYSLISQSIQMSQANIEDSDWVKNIDNKSISDYSSEEKIEDFEKYITGNLKKTKVYGFIIPDNSPYKFPTYKNMNNNRVAPTTGSGSRFYTVELVNGSFIFVNVSASTDGTVTVPYIFADVNGKKGPNVYEKDLFFFLINGRGQLYMPGHLSNREKILSDCTHSQNMYGITCQSLIMHDGWQIKDDYPW